MFSCSLEVGFWLVCRRVNVQIRSWKHICLTDCDVAITELMRPLLTLRTSFRFPRSAATWLVATTINISVDQLGDYIILWPHLWKKICCQGLISSSAFHYSPCFGVLPVPPSSDETSALYLLQPVDGNLFNLHFQMTFNSVTLRWKPGYWYSIL